MALPVSKVSSTTIEFVSIWTCVSIHSSSSSLRVKEDWVNLLTVFWVCLETMPFIWHQNAETLLVLFMSKHCTMLAWSTRTSLASISISQAISHGWTLVHLTDPCSNKELRQWQPSFSTPTSSGVSIIPESLSARSTTRSCMIHMRVFLRVSFKTTRFTQLLTQDRLPWSFQSSTMSPSSQTFSHMPKLTNGNSNQVWFGCHAISRCHLCTSRSMVPGPRQGLKTTSSDSMEVPTNVSYGLCHLTWQWIFWACQCTWTTTWFMTLWRVR